MALGIRGRMFGLPIEVPRIGTIHPDKAVLLRKDIVASLVGRTGHIHTLADVAQKAPFSSVVEGGQPQPPVTLVLDIDGVVTPNSFRNLRALQTVIAPRMTEFIPWTGRMHVGKGGDRRTALPFPFIDDATVIKLQGFVRRGNPNCDTSTAMVGFRKQFPAGRQEFTQTILDRLQKGQQVVIVGSDNVDDQRVRQVIQAAQFGGVDLKGLHYYNTDRALIPSVLQSIRKRR